MFVIQITQTGTRICRGRRFEVSKGERGPIDTNAANDVVLSLNKFDDEFTESDRHDVSVLEAGSTDFRMWQKNFLDVCEKIFLKMDARSQFHNKGQICYTRNT